MDTSRPLRSTLQAAGIALPVLSVVTMLGAAPAQAVASPAPPVAALVAAPAASPTATPTDAATASPSPTDAPTATPTSEPTVVTSQTEQDSTAGNGTTPPFTGGSGQLAFTGAPIGSYVLLSAGLLAGGGLMLRLGRRRSAQ